MGGIDDWLRRPAWFADAVCDDTELMFDHERQAEAAAVCRPCPVKRDCLVSALRRREPDGVWGGMTTREREIVLKADLSVTMYQVVTTVRSSGGSRLPRGA